MYIPPRFWIAMHGGVPELIRQPVDKLGPIPVAVQRYLVKAYAAWGGSPLPDTVPDRETVRRWLVGLPGLDIEVLFALAFDDDRGILMRVASFPQMPRLLLYCMSRLGGDGYLASKLKANLALGETGRLSLPDRLLRRLVQHPKTDVRVRLASCPEISLSVLQQLVNDADALVQNAAVGNPLLPQTERLALIARSELSIDVLDKLATCNDAVVLRALWMAERHRTQLRTAMFARNPCADVEMLWAYWHELVGDVQHLGEVSTLLWHPNLPDALLVAIANHHGVAYGFGVTEETHHRLRTMLCARGLDHCGRPAVV